MDDLDGREDPFRLMDVYRQRRGLQPFQELDERLHIHLPWLSMNVVLLLVLAAMRGAASPRINERA
jgi:hypothetical protein